MILASGHEPHMHTIATMALLMGALLTGLVWSIAVSLRRIARSLDRRDPSESSS